MNRLTCAALLLASQAGAIGVRQMEIRLAAGETARVTLWYPSASSGQPVRMSDYLHLDGYKGDLGEAAATLVARDPATVSSETRAEALTTRFRALRDARPRVGRYPLVLWSVRHGTVAGQAYLSESLARAGFAVASVEPLGWKPLLPTQAADGRQELRKHVAFLEQSIGELAKLPQIDAKRIAVIGWSYGGESAVQLAASNPSVALLLGLSASGLSSAPYGGEGSLKDTKVTVPTVWFEERVRANGVRAVSGEPLEASASDAHYIRLAGMKHGCFSTVEGWLAARVGIREPQPWSLATPACARGYEHVVEIAVRYVTYYLRSARQTAQER